MTESREAPNCNGCGESIVPPTYDRQVWERFGVPLEDGSAFALVRFWHVGGSPEDVRELFESRSKASRDA